MKRSAIALVSIVLAAPALAIDYVWIGGTSGSWSTATNWSPAGVPSGNPSSASILAAPAAAVVTLGESITIGRVGIGLGNRLELANSGTVLAVQPLGTPSAEGLRNEGTLRAGSGATLELRNGTHVNTGGTIEAASGSFVELAGGATLSRGTLSTEGTAQVRVTGVNTIENITLRGELNVRNFSQLELVGTIDNRGTLNLLAANNLTDLRLKGNATLAGIGTVALGNSSNNRIIGDSSADRLTIEAGQTIRGAGLIGSNQEKFSNAGLILADQPTALVIDPGPGAEGFTNRGQAANQGLRAASGATLRLLSGEYANTGGLIEAGAGSFVELGDGARIIGGLVRSVGSGVVRTAGNSVALDSATLEGALQVRNLNRLDLAGTITNNGSLALQSTGGFTDLRIVGSTTLAGGGELVLGGNSSNRVYGATNTDLLTVGAGQTVRGGGALGDGRVRILNEGTIRADSAAAPLTIDVAGFAESLVNRGTMRIDAGRAMTIASGDQLTQDATAARIEVFGTLTANSLDLRAGVLTGNGTVIGAVQNRGGMVAPGSSPGTLRIEGTFSQQPGGVLVIEIAGPAAGQYDRLQVTGNASLAGDLLLDFGFTPALGLPFVVLTTESGNISGEFERILVPDGWTLGQPIYAAKSLTLSVAAVPEPETYAMMLAGIGLVGLAARRRRTP